MNSYYRHAFMFRCLFVIILVLLVNVITACTSIGVGDNVISTDEPAESSKEWYLAVNQLEILKADGLTCTTRRKAFRAGIEDRMVRGSSLVVFNELIEDSTDIDIDVSETEFVTVKQEGDEALVTAKGEIRGAIGNNIHSAKVNESWLMVREDGDWRWCGISDVLSGDQRTYYDTLALDTPEETVQTFSDAFQRRDFITVYLVLAPRTQFRMQQDLRLLNYSNFFKLDRWEEIKSEVSTFSHGIGYGEHTDADLGYMFDQIMLAASRHDAFLIDLRGEVTIVGRETVETSWEGTAIDIITDVDGIEGHVVFRTVQAPSGRWRVFQVIVPGGDEEMWPWAVPITDK